MINLNYTIEELAKMCGGQLIINRPDLCNVSDIIIDSRKLSSISNCMFIALKSGRNDGHKYMEDLYNAGLRVFLVSDVPAVLWAREANFIKVENTQKALQKIAAEHRKRFNLKVIGITGSNGKTIVKEWIYSCLNEYYKLVRSPKSFNSQIGVPLSVLQITENHQIGIFEAGISETDEMDKLEKVIQPDIGIFLNIGTAHDENFINTTQKINEKLQLFKKAKTLIYCRDHHEINECILKTGVFREIELLTWSSKQKGVNLFVSGIHIHDQQTVLKAVYKDVEQVEITIPFTDAASIENAIQVWLLLLYLNLDRVKITNAFTQLAQVAMRLELKEGINHCSIINDSYSSDLSSLNIAIDFLKQQAKNHKKTVILSDILQSGLSEPELYSEVARILKEKGINQLIGIGKAIGRQADRFPLKKYFYESTGDFIKYHPLSKFQNEAILIKGARSFEFEHINKILEQKVHETVMEINLNSMLENLNFYRSLIGQKVKVMAMVKAFSYGSGSFEIANMLQFHQVDYLTVAYADEGVELRKAGITMPIMVMSPEPESFDLMIHHNLEPEIYSFRLLEMLDKAISQEMIQKNESIGIHIKIDSGMHRLGFLPAEIEQLSEYLKEHKNIKVKTVFSHLAASDDEQFDDFTSEQIQSFEKASDMLQIKLNYPFSRHILNSAGIHRFPEARFDMVRLGIGLYGISSDSQIQTKLKNVSRLKTRISQIKTIAKNESVGYSRKFIAPQETKIAIIPIGYADGLNRLLSNGLGKMKIHNQFVPIIGNVCMDMCMLDISNIDANEGDEVIVFDSAESIHQLAQLLHTIEYEILTSVSRRVKRVYYQE